MIADPARLEQIRQEHEEDERDGYLFESTEQIAVRDTYMHHQRGELLAALAVAEAQRAQLQTSHSGEGTFPCTCQSYPHSPNCGLDARLVWLREQNAALTAQLAQARQWEEHYYEVRQQRDEALAQLAQARQATKANSPIPLANEQLSRWFLP